MKTHGLRLIVLTLFLALTCLWPGERCQAAESGDGIAFLTLQVTTDTVTLISWQSVPGKLKRLRHQRETSGLLYEATAAGGEVLWQGSLPNPLIQRFEYEDPDNPGVLKSKLITRDSATVVIRLPADLAAQRISFWKLRAAASTDGTKTSVRRIDLGTISWPPDGAE